MSIINEADYAWSRHVVTVPVGTTAFELPVKIYAARGDGALWLDSEATTAVSEFPVAVDEITVTGAEMKLIGEQGRGVPVESTYLDTAEGMTALEWTSRTDKFTVPLPFEFKWAGTAYTEFTLSAAGIISFNGGSTYHIRVHSYWLATWCSPDVGIYTQTGTSGSRQFVKVRFDGTCYYGSTTESYRSIWELFMFDDGSIFINSVLAPTISTTNAFNPGTSQVFTINPGGSQYIIATSADSGVTWAFDYLDGSQRTTLFLIRKDGVLHTVASGALTAIEATEQAAAVFLEYGFAELSTFVPEGAYSVLCWSTGQAPTVTAKLTGSPPSQEMTCTVDMSHPSISGIQQMTAEYSGTVELCHRITGGEWTQPMELSDWVAQDFNALYASLGEDKLLYLKFYLYGGAEFTNFRITFIN